MTKRLAGVALAAMLGACALAGRAHAAIITYGGQGTYDGDNYYYDTFTYDTYTNKGTAFVSYGFPPGSPYSLTENSSTVISVSTSQDNLNIYKPVDGQSLNFGITFASSVAGAVPDGNGGVLPVNTVEPLSFGVTIFAVADSRGQVSLFSQGGFSGYYNGDDSPSSVDISPVPLPSSAWSFGIALLALGASGAARAIKQKSRSWIGPRSAGY